MLQHSDGWFLPLRAQFSTKRSFHCELEALPMVAEWCHCVNGAGAQSRIGRSTRWLVGSQVQDAPNILPVCCIHWVPCSQLSNASSGQQIFLFVAYNLCHRNKLECINDEWEHLHVPGKPILCNSRIRWTTVWLRWSKARRYECSAAALNAPRHIGLLSAQRSVGSMFSSFSQRITLASAISYFSERWLRVRLTIWSFRFCWSWGVSMKCSWASCADDSSYFCLRQKHRLSYAYNAHHNTYLVS